MLQRRQSKDAEAIRPSPTYFSQEQVGRQPAASNASSRSTLLRRISPSSSITSRGSANSPSNFTADYLNDLRKNRPARPTGARPLPGRKSTIPDRNSTASPALERDVPPRAGSAMAFRPSVADVDAPERSFSAMSHRRAQSSLDNPSDAGRPLARPPITNAPDRHFSTSTNMTNTTNATKRSSMSKNDPEKQYSIPYYERGQRWMEKQEVGSLRSALEDMDKKQEEAKLHAAAQDEAAELVYQHQNPHDTGAPYRNPDMSYRHHLRKGSHARSQSFGPYKELYVKKGSVEGHRSASEGSNSSGGSRVVSSGSNASEKSSADENREGQTDRTASKPKGFGSLKSRYGSLPFSVQGPRALLKRHSTKTRTTSGESGQSIFRNPEDQIYEEPEDVATTVNMDDHDDAKPKPLAVKPRNTSYGSLGVNQKAEKLLLNNPSKKVSIVDIYKNPPSQSRDAGYQRNAYPARVDSLEEQPPMKDGVEIRSNDIRAATSMKLKDRSEKLPMPTMVSDRPGRPIVSFKEDYKLPTKELVELPSSRPSTKDGAVNKPLSALKPPLSTAASEPVLPVISISDAPSIQVNDAPTIPTINAPEIPSIDVTDDVPSISVSDATSIAVTPIAPPVDGPSSRTSARPLPKPGASARPQPANRPLPHHSSTAPVKSVPHWTPTSNHRTGAQCAACALPISGRIVGAANQRFHPACFTCFSCGTQLECVAFYPEPDNHRSSRLARIDARFHGEPIPEDQAHITPDDDGDDGLRFFCHLDFHEQFSPRCRSCKTPIEGEVIVACGGEWHAGHFFCAECGDPFDEKTPFVEKDGFAWCTGCHTRKFVGKCAGCKKPIHDMVLKAMGMEWHGGCFVCCTCGGGFGDGRFFVREGEGLPVCVGCEERRLKA